MDEDVSSSNEHDRAGRVGGARPRGDVGGAGPVPLVPPPVDRARYRPLRGLEELLDDVLRGTG